MAEHELEGGMRIAITGTTGYIGARLQSHLQKTHKIIPVSRNGGDGYPPFDLSQPFSLHQTLNLLNVDVIIHAAAIARRNKCTENPELAHVINVEATKVIAEWANQRGIRLIFLSSIGIHEDNAYANTKRLAEQIIHATGSINTTLRLAYAFGFSPSNSRPKPMQRLEQEVQFPDTVSFDDSWHFQPTSLEHVCHVTQAIVENKSQPEELNVVTTEASTMFEIASACLSHPIQARNDLKERQEHFISKTYLSDFKLPECSIASFFEEVRNTLQHTCKTNIYD